MKNTLIIMLTVFVSSAAGAQDVCPEFANMVNVISYDGASAQELGMEQPNAKTKSKGGWGGPNQAIRLEGSTAKTAVKPTAAFAFKPLNAQVHPRQQIKLYPFKIKRKYRELMVGGKNAWGGSKDRKNKDNSVELRFEKISDGCYKVTAASGKFEPGEYAFSLSSVGMGAAGASVKGAGTADVAGQTWYGFSVK